MWTGHFKHPNENKSKLPQSLNAAKQVPSSNWSCSISYQFEEKKTSCKTEALAHLKFKSANFWSISLVRTVTLILIIFYTYAF
jgi:hypothetical protein